MPSGTITTVFATEGSWYRVLHGLPTQYGWTHTSNAVQVPGFDTAVRARTANLRAGPGVDHPVLDRLELLTSIQVEDERDGWYRVTHDGNAGWIAGWLTQGRR
jgi:SH3-like domain-containing protein